MLMSPGVRRFALTAHLSFSVAWIGSVAAFLALAVTGVTTRDPIAAMASYVAMEVIGWFVIVPLSFASPLTGILQAVGTKWGLFRHYWILVKFLITLPCTAILLLHMQPTSRLAATTRDATLSGPQLHGLQIQLMADSIAAALVLVIATMLAVYKPGGMTPWSNGGGFTQAFASMPRWVKAFALIGLALLLAFLISHVGGMRFGHPTTAFLDDQ